MNDGAEKARLGGIRFAKVLVWLVYAYFVAAVIILVLTFFLELFNASTDASFTEWVYRSADSVLAPFAGIFPSVEGRERFDRRFRRDLRHHHVRHLRDGRACLVNWLDDRMLTEKRRQQKAQWEAQDCSRAGPVAPAVGTGTGRARHRRTGRFACPDPARRPVAGDIQGAGGRRVPIVPRRVGLLRSTGRRAAKTTAKRPLRELSGVGVSLLSRGQRNW